MTATIHTRTEPSTLTAEARSLIDQLDVLSRRLVEIVSPGEPNGTETDQLFDVRDRMSNILDGSDLPTGGSWSASADDLRGATKMVEPPHVVYLSSAQRVEVVNELDAGIDQPARLAVVDGGVRVAVGRDCWSAPIGSTSGWGF